jgi:hypothetical protein
MIFWEFNIHYGTCIPLTGPGKGLSFHFTQTMKSINSFHVMPSLKSFWMNKAVGLFQEKKMIREP